jgi:hypothetical protein
MGVGEERYLAVDLRWRGADKVEERGASRGEKWLGLGMNHVRLPFWAVSRLKMDARG